MKILVTGSAGFIGFHLARRFCERGDDVLGIDNLNNYYDVSLKRARLRQLEQFENFTFKKMDIANRTSMENLFIKNSFDRVVHMAAQAGVRYSLVNPHAYVQSNLVGFLNILEGCRSQWTGHGSRDTESGNSIVRSPVTDLGSRHLIYASSSSIYGLNTKMPFSVSDKTETPVSLYGATKKANELMAHSYSYLYGIPITGLRFFTVYGPWGRPDMALFKFTKAILNGDPIDVYNEGRMKRDFTYIDDIVEGVVRVTDKIPEPGTRNTEHGAQTYPGSRIPEPVPYRLYNIGNHSPVNLMDFIAAIEESLGKKAKINYLPMQPGDVIATYADVDDLVRDVGFSPSTPIRDGIRKFIEWYKSYYT